MARMPGRETRGALLTLDEISRRRVDVHVDILPISEIFSQNQALRNKKSLFIEFLIANLLEKGSVDLNRLRPLDRW